LQALRSFPDAPEMAGVYRVSDDQLRIARRSILLSGNMTAARGASVAHDSLVASLVSIGVCLTRYDGQMRSWADHVPAARLRSSLVRSGGRGSRHAGSACAAQ